MAKKATRKPIRKDYTVHASETGKRLSAPVRLAFLSDLHCEDYGPKQGPIMDILKGFDPHAVLIGGDAYDERRIWDKTNETISLCAENWRTFYTPGNHEVKTRAAERCKKEAEAAGAVVLAGTGILIRGDAEPGTEADGSVFLCGAEDPLKQEEEHSRQMRACADLCAERPTCFSILMTHRPERVDEYKSFPADLILTGHAHGGQWIFPGIPNGVYGPDQGIFPKYGGGEFVWKTNRMICSRGLGNVTHIARFGNPPELVCITVLP